MLQVVKSGTTNGVAPAQIVRQNASGTLTGFSSGVWIDNLYGSTLSSGQYVVGVRSAQLQSGNPIFLSTSTFSSGTGGGGGIAGISAGEYKDTAFNGGIDISDYPTLSGALDITAVSGSAWTKLITNVNAGLTLTGGSGSVLQLGQVAATQDQAGCVSTGGQFIAGIKTFHQDNTSGFYNSTELNGGAITSIASSGDIANPCEWNLVGGLTGAAFNNSYPSITLNDAPSWFFLSGGGLGGGAGISLVNNGAGSPALNVFPELFINGSPYGAASLGAGSITSGLLADNSVNSGNISSGSISQYQMSSGAINSGQIGNAAVVSGSIASGQISRFAMSSGAINSGQVGNSAVVSGSVASGSLGTNHFASGTLSVSLTSGQITSGYVGNNAVVSGSIASGQIGKNHLASGTLSFSLTSGQVSSGFIGNNAVVSGSIASGSISHFAIASGGITSGSIASGTIGTNHLGILNQINCPTYNALSGTLQMQVAGSTAIFCDSDGYIGIGTNTPYVRLTLQGDESPVAFAFTGTDATFGPEIRQISTADGGHEWRYGSSASSSNVPAGAGAWFLYDATMGAVRLSIDPSGVLWIDQNWTGTPTNTGGLTPDAWLQINKSDGTPGYCPWYAE